MDQPVNHRLVIMSENLLFYFFSLLLLLLILFHLHLAPYTKVEESFNIQAAHDFYKWGLPRNATSPAEFLRTRFDHFTFPGAVPRTATGAYALAKVAGLLAGESQGGLSMQICIRKILGVFNALALIFYGRGLKKAYGRVPAIWYTIFLLGQFHIIYYASRTLPNMFAFGLTTFGLKLKMPHSHWRSEQSFRDKVAIILLAISGVVFRSEVALLLGTASLALLARGRLSPWHIVSAGLFGVCLGLWITVPFDSFFWQKNLFWPELTGFLFNVVHGRASAWGTSPWGHYFTNFLPKLLMNPMTYLVCIPWALSMRSTRRDTIFLLFPSLAFITAYSFQPHKEWRFIVYTLPPICGAAGIGASYMWIRRHKTFTYKVLSMCLVATSLVSFAISNLVLLPISMANYPGGEALTTLQHRLSDANTDVTVWMDTFTCQTGVTRWLEVAHPSNVYPNATWTYDRTEDELVKQSPKFWEKFDYAIVEVGRTHELLGDWDEFEEIRGYGGVRLARKGEETPGTDAVEAKLFTKVLGEKGPEVWKLSERLARLVTQGYWVEINMVPKIQILKRRREAV